MSGDVTGVCHTGGCGVVAEATEGSIGSVAQRVVGGCVHASAYGPEVCERGFYGALESYYGALSSYISNVAIPRVSGPVGSGGDACLVGDKDGLLLPVWYGPTWNNGLRSGCDDARLERAEIGVSGLPSGVAFNRRFLDGGVEATTSENLLNRGFVEGTLVEHSPSGCVGGVVGSIGKNFATRSGGESAELDRFDVGGCGLKSKGCEKEAGSSGSCVVEKKPVPVDPSGCEGVSGVAEKTLRNRQWRMDRKHRKQKRKAMGSDWRRGKDVVVESRGVFSECDKVVRLELLNSRAARYRAQNELEILKAKREIQVLEANDIESEVKRYRTKVSSQVEKNMVAIEKTHATLIATGNVPGFAETVVDGVPSLTSGSISPDSSASQAEFRAAQKRILDMEAEAARMLAAFKKLGISYEAALAIDKQTFTDDTRGNELYEELHPEADAAAIHYKYVDGKKKFSLGLDPDGFC